MPDVNDEMQVAKLIEDLSRENREAQKRVATLVEEYSKLQKKYDREVKHHYKATVHITELMQMNDNQRKHIYSLREEKDRLEANYNRANDRAINSERRANFARKAYTDEVTMIYSIVDNVSLKDNQKIDILKFALEKESDDYD